MPLKLTCNITQDRYSWTEAHYLLNFSALPTPGVGPNPQDAIVSQYSVLRGATLGNYASIDSIRLSLVPANRLVVDYFQSTSQQGPIWPVVPDNEVYASDRGYSAILIRMLGLISNKNWFFAGIPDSCIQTVPYNRRGLQLGGPPGWLARYNALMAFLTAGANGFGFRSRTAAGQQQAQGLVTNAAYPGMIGVVVNASLGVPVGNEVLMKGWRRSNTRLGGLSGAFEVGAILFPVAPATQYTYFLLNTSTVSPTNFLGLGTIGPLSFQYIPYQGAEPIKAVSHKRGASYGAPRGRLSRRAH